MWFLHSRFHCYWSSKLSFHPRNISNLHQDPSDRQIVITRAQTATWTDLIRSNSNPIFKIPPTWRFVCVPISSSKIQFLSTYSGKFHYMARFRDTYFSKVYLKIPSFADPCRLFSHFTKMGGFFSYFVDLSWLIEFVQSREKVSRLEFSSAKRKRKMHIVAWKICFQIRTIPYLFNEKENLINCSFLRITHLSLTRNYYSWNTWSGKPLDQSITRFVPAQFRISYLFSWMRGSCRSLPGFLFHHPCPYFLEINSNRNLYVYR